MSELDTVTVFPRDENSRINITSGEYRDVNATQTNVKYAKEVWFALRVAMVKTTAGKIEGRRCELFDYTNKTIIPKDDWQRKINDDLNRVINLKGDRFGKRNKWYVDLRDGRVFEDYLLKPDRISGIIESKRKVLSENRITTVK